MNIEFLTPIFISFIVNCDSIVDMRIVHYLLDRISDSKKIMARIANDYAPQIMGALK